MKLTKNRFVALFNKRIEIYQVWDRANRQWAEFTEDADKATVEQWAEDENNEANQFDDHIKETER
jgi:hypothetical protein